MYGDELEYILIKLDHNTKKYKILLKADEIINVLANKTNSIWHPEYSNYMIEGTPNRPYKCSIADLLSIEDDLKRRKNDTTNSNHLFTCYIYFNIKNDFLSFCLIYY